MKIKEITQALEHFAPLSLQEDYDNAGLLIGDENEELEQALICLDVTHEVIDEAIQKDCQLIIAHHPLIFKGLKKINGKNDVEQIVIKAIKNNIAIYAFHTNADNVVKGVNGMIANKLGLKNIEVLQSKKSILNKLVVFCPDTNADLVRSAMFEAGAGQIGNYGSCSFNARGEGTFKANEGANPYVGTIDKLHIEKETRIEVIFPVYLKSKIISALINAHPYEEVAYDVYPVENEFVNLGSGGYGEFEKEMKAQDFLKLLKEVFGSPFIKHTKILNKPIKKVAFCGGSGSFLIRNAKAKNADVFVTGDMKYHDFFEAENQILLVDIGHYESEQFTNDLIYSILNKKFPTFALRISEIKTNPVNYF